MSPAASPASDHEQRLEDAVLSYLKAVDAGHPPNPGEVIARHPDLAAELSIFFADQERLDPLVAPLRCLALANPARQDGEAPKDEPESPGWGDARDGKRQRQAPATAEEPTGQP